jgi:hypothetical protein
LFECIKLAKQTVNTTTQPEATPQLPRSPEPSALGTLDSRRNSVNWRLESVRQVRILVGQGYRRIAAQQQIADALARSIDELQAWERELVQSSDLENELLCSEFAGELLEYLRSGHYTNVPHYKSYGSYMDRFNVARAATIAKAMRQFSLSEIRGGLRLRRRQRPLS